MDYAALRNEILNGPHAAACAPFVIDWSAPKTVGAAVNDQAIADLLNNALGTMVAKSRFVTARSMLAELDPGVAATVLDKLEAAGATISAVKWAMRYITADGIDIGHPATVAMFQQLVAGGVLTSDEASAVLGLAQAQVGYAESILGAPVTGADVSIALRGNAVYDPRV